MALHSERDLLLEMTQGNYLQALGQFQQRVLYAPIFDDDIVNYQSAALAWDIPEEFQKIRKSKKKMEECLKKDDHIYGEEILKKEDENKESMQYQTFNENENNLLIQRESYKAQRYYSQDSKAPIFEKMITNLRTLEWKRVNVLVKHEFLVAWSKKKCLCICKWNKDEDPEHRMDILEHVYSCLLYTSPSPRDRQKSRMPSSA
eukprot:TRINITY_DN3395_c0_g1_i4.p1 TRINITY_DN3395_c0_g1~~TRINITY_DN3395_c0_g1_i4.p1  ORF type:complete len:203 (-),score=47.79 TRINITY_DN3395_c0_g1_i4:35-643(-)